MDNHSITAIKQSPREKIKHAPRPSSSTEVELKLAEKQPGIILMSNRLSYFLDKVFACNLIILTFFFLTFSRRTVVVNIKLRSTVFLQCLLVAVFLDF
jgi:hypothetical protein